MHDLVIKSGTVIDGSGAQGFSADIAVDGGVISAVGRLSQNNARKVLDAGGKTVVPGFIDMHSHGDCSLPGFPDMENYIQQGVTTVFTGHCGLSIAPVYNYWVLMFPERPAFRALDLEPENGFVPGFGPMVPTDRLREVMQDTMGYQLDWSSFGQYLAHLSSKGTAGNILPLVGHAALRAQVTGPDFRRKARADEITLMKQYLVEAIEEGAAGLSLGLDYEPGIYACAQELMELAHALPPGAILFAHCRSRELLKGYREFLELVRQTGVHGHISHLDCRDREDAERILAITHEYRSAGAKVSYDVIPPGQGGPFYFPQLAGKFIKYVKACGGLKAFGRALKKENFRQQILSDFRSSPLGAGGNQWDAAYYITRCRHKEWEHRSLRDIAAENNLPVDVQLLHILAADPHTCYVQPPRPNEGRAYLIGDGDASIGFDCAAYDYNWAPSPPGEPLEYAAPSTYHGTIRFLKEKIVPTVEGAIHKLTGRPAEILGLDRGLLREGKRADIVILDLEKLGWDDDPIDPRTPPSGVEHVIVNGIVELESRRQKFRRPGEILTR